MSSSSSTPPTAKDLTQEALQANKDHQYALKVYTERLEAELEAVDKLLAAAEAPDDEPEVDVGGHLEMSGAVKAAGPIPPEIAFEDHPFAEDAVKRRHYLQCTTVHPMKPADLEALADAVRSENHRIYALEAQRRGQQPFVALNEHPQPFFEQNKEGINWERVAQKVSAAGVHGISRTAEECEIRWLGERHPDFDRSNWSQPEISRLKELIGDAKEGEVDWVQIAAKLGTRRTPIDCMRHAIPRKVHVWTAESDQRLLEMVDVYGTENWLLVARQVSEDATAGQCQSRYQRTLQPGLRRGPWTQEEDTRLKRATEVFGRSWIDVAAFVPTRNNEQCRERWHEHVNPTVGRGRWTEEEDAALLSAYEAVGDKWKEVSLRVGSGRTDNMCRHRYVLLMKRRAKETADSSPVAQDSGISTPEPVAGPSQPRRRGRAATVQQDLQPESTKEAPVAEDSTTAPSKPKPKPRARTKRAQATQEPEPSTSDSANLGAGAGPDEAAANPSEVQTSTVDPTKQSTTEVAPSTEEEGKRNPKPKPKPKPKRRRGGSPGSDDAPQGAPEASEQPATKKRRGRPVKGPRAVNSDNEVPRTEQSTDIPNEVQTMPATSQEATELRQKAVTPKPKGSGGRKQRDTPPPPTRQSARLRNARS
ncbi:snRNA-activating protein complex subunit 4 [Phanerochaete sordida]|uniref:snRNA-activating protein complex subunit 4 n=1 Tax=Phanerochaete sordida TaxID=48140 RepID=A0A9P3FYJ3_9APHY|nr:snRNA-activating protein complex subunit 4 [Phanerochaete sordida]